MPKNQASERQNESDGEKFSGDYSEVQRRVREFNERTDENARRVADAGTDM